VETKIRNLGVLAQVVSMVCVFATVVSISLWAIYAYNGPIYSARMYCEKAGWVWLMQEEKCIMIKEIK
jgi:hypothetical protein